jgi:membrane-associated HD superfamily phosphohydrolase
MNIFIYFSTYIILAGFLYYFNIINFNPFIWLIIALFASIIITCYVIIIKIEKKEKYNYNYYYRNLFIYLILNSPKLLLLLIINKKNLFNGFIFYSTLFIIYLFLINFNLYDIYYTNTTLKIINNDFSFSLI